MLTVAACANRRRPDALLWRSAQLMATTLATAVVSEAREVLRCEHCQLVQFRTLDSHCRRCRKALEVEEPEPLIPQLVPAGTVAAAVAPPELDVAGAVRQLRRERGLSQRQLAGRMQVPRTYISKIENAKAMPTLSSLERLASALEADIAELVQDGRSRRQKAVDSLLADPFLAEILPAMPRMTAYQRAVFMNQLRDMASGRKVATLA